MRTIAFVAVLILSVSSVVVASDYEIANIKPIFNTSTPGFGDFKIQVGIKTYVQDKSAIIVSCPYIGLTHPGVYYKNEPKIMKQYKKVSIGPSEEIQIMFDKGFVAYHPETKGEIILSLVGTGVVRSYPLKTSFHPESSD
jgi:hypothetical protein